MRTASIKQPPVGDQHDCTKEQSPIWPLNTLATAAATKTTQPSVPRQCHSEGHSRGAPRGARREEQQQKQQKTEKRWIHTWYTVIEEDANCHHCVSAGPTKSLGLDCKLPNCPHILLGVATIAQPTHKQLRLCPFGSRGAGPGCSSQSRGSGWRVGVSS